MIKIVLIIKEDCPACSIVKRVITEAINKIDCDITLRVLSNKGFRADSYNVKVYPTTIFYKAKSAKGTIFEGNFEEIQFHSQTTGTFFRVLWERSRERRCCR
jgi:hypothetical protein